ncbi:3-ketoacyl-ACP reductase [Burkholderia sp. A9]|uniref:SDR family oxidoreductase n=1 Tax=Burkholderia TaxID=32008 RepID=UPI000574AAE1|nr:MULTISPECIES: SDR family oxidoreductase [Burkholderia]KHK59077.1 3-ketoacyl-ACP reductase [Burkholderia sp. A9]KUZ34868.1 3-ketoacyl-ACP reductase [Burkholderia territorii]KUZ59679.1 3-ketoacyl-ACP reductase [Burkholderia territorii]KVC15905.1 3-ketoacyl-ACP reductase [Burkholderia diffusa]RQS24820.1 SDR family oxidoreductase [Burkholderia sp. Bp8995]
MAQLSGKKVLVTGALGTIGRALVARFAEEGATVIALDRPGVEGAQETLGKLGSDVRYFGCDLNQLSATEAAVSALAEEVGGIDVLVNNAALVIMKPFEQFSIEEYEDQVRINSSAAFVLARACSGAMKARRYGKIVNVTSLTLTGQWDGYVPYIASKGALFGLIKGLARELGAHGVNVNGISPGAVVSEAEFRDRADSREQYNNWILERQSLKRRIEAVDVANLALFLASPQSDLITGQNIQIDGGW